MGRTITGEKRLEARLREVLLRGLTGGKEISAVIIGCKVSFTSAFVFLYVCRFQSLVFTY